MSEAKKAGVSADRALNSADNPIDDIVEIDRAAREKVAAAQERAEKILADADAKKRTLGDDNAARLAAETDEKFAETRKKTDANIVELEKAAEEKCRLLDEKMAAKRSEWKREITERILG